MKQISLGDIDDSALRPISRPQNVYFLVIGLLGLGILAAALVWLYQVKTGMGVAAIHDPVDWGVYIANFVYWVGIAHSGTLISAILFLLRAKFRDGVSRATEAMTIFAIMTAGLFPMVHLGRFWVIYYMLPYPTQRNIWPNFQSPLVWDVLAVSTYFTVSLIFFYVGLIPDLAAFRDRLEATLGVKHWKTRIYQALASGWSGAGGQWRHYGRSYLYFAALATPLVISVHTVVSWDFAVSLLPGWHSTIFGPYFVAGAIHSGLAMALVLLIPMRRLLNLKDLIRVDHLEMVAKTMLVTTAIITYSYIIEPFIAWYSGDRFEWQFAVFRATGWPAPIYWSLSFLNVLAPLSFVIKRARRSIPVLFAVGVLVNTGMWLERIIIVTASTAHDFMPHNWSSYFPNRVEISITAGSICFFSFFYLLFAKTLPVLPITDYKTGIGEKELGGIRVKDVPAPEEKKISGLLPSATVVYADPASLIEAVKKVRGKGFLRMEFFSPIKLEKLQKLFGYKKSPVRYWTLIGVITGAIAGFSLAILSADANGLIVGGKHPVSIIPYCVVGFEGMILLGSIANLIGFFVHSRFYFRELTPYDPRYSRNTFGLVVESAPEEFPLLKETISKTAPVETRFNE
jgi:Ni/Fe-hydrogenase subunit HybB-like protein